MHKLRIKVFVILLMLLSGIAGLLLSLHKYTNVFGRADNAVTTIETFHYPAMFVHQLEGDKHAGRKIFQEFCSACHASKPRIDIQAPRIGDKSAWEPKSKWGMPALLKITINGVGAMPARGGCFECSDEQLQATIQYILDSSK